MQERIQMNTQEHGAPGTEIRHLAEGLNYEVAVNSAGKEHLLPGRDEDVPAYLAWYMNAAGVDYEECCDEA